ncbi:MAG: helix-hairpin-helix domain-containing protein [Xanthomonadales bacterium]|jgi:competence protein ComEA|nr:helix-hairpin-helix domain-containing protein [Xanthomonadales bacterium]
MRKLLSALILSLSLSFGAYAQSPAETVDLNTADAVTLARVLNGVGPAKAEAIIAYREANGPFQHIDELVKVKGIGLRTIDLNRNVMAVEAAPAAAPQPAAVPAAPAARPVTPVATAPRPAGG